MASDQETQFPLLNYIRRMSGGYSISLSEALSEQDKMPHSTLWSHHFNADGQNHEGIFQLLIGQIGPDDRFFWTLFNFDTCQVSERTCWGSEPRFFVVRDSDEDESNRPH